ncbi:enoyl-CoA hydratase-related protein [Streptomyces sp. NPDC002896]|uniref:enoyl-CoA hydratase/isomerase family protein n=1 Tax=Streptomyces sp. NPDC002896 TaxID=3154438 RepID=UPI0033344F57
MADRETSAQPAPEYGEVAGLRVGLEGTVLRLTLDRPEKKNAVSDTVNRALTALLGQAQNDERVRAVLLDSSGPDFCAGADIVARNSGGGPRPRPGAIQRRLPSLAHGLIPTLMELQLPVVCAVRGWAAGLGLHLALACDFAVVARDAVLWEPFLTRGFTPDSAGTWLLPRLVGPVRARELVLLGERFNGEDAARWGLVHRAVDDKDVDGTAQDLARRLARGPTVALGLAKKLLNDGLQEPLRRHLESEAFAMELSSRARDFGEGMAAFAERRPPRFEGR